MSALRGIIACPMCGRSGGHISAGQRICTRCIGRYKPTRLQLWRDVLGIPVADLARAARVSRDTVQVALRGEPIGPRAAKRLERVTKIPAHELIVGRVEVV